MMDYNLSSTGVVATLMAENKNNGQKYEHTVHEAGINSSCQYHTFYYSDANKKVTMIVSEEENPKDALSPDCCKLFRISIVHFNKFFSHDDTLRDRLLRDCDRPVQGRGFGHCKFHTTIDKKHNGPFMLPGGKNPKKTCTNKKLA